MFSIPSRKQEMETIPVDITIAKYAGCKFIAKSFISEINFEVPEWMLLLFLFIFYYKLVIVL